MIAEPADADFSYFCPICKLFDDSPDAKIYHCPYCNLCRKGRGLGIGESQRVFNYRDPRNISRRCLVSRP